MSNYSNQPSEDAQRLRLNKTSKMRRTRCSWCRPRWSKSKPCNRKWTDSIMRFKKVKTWEPRSKECSMMASSNRTQLGNSKQWLIQLNKSPFGVVGQLLQDVDQSTRQTSIASMQTSTTWRKMTLNEPSTDQFDLSILEIHDFVKSGPCHKWTLSTFNVRKSNFLKVCFSLIYH